MAPSVAGEEEFFDGDSENLASGEIGHVVEAMNEFGVEVWSSKKHKAVKLRAPVSIGGTRSLRRNAIATAPSAKAAWLGVPELECDENHDDHDERNVVPFARLVSIVAS